MMLSSGPYVVKIGGGGIVGRYPLPPYLNIDLPAKIKDKIVQPT